MKIFMFRYIKVELKLYSIVKFRVTRLTLRRKSKFRRILTLYEITNEMKVLI